MEFEEALRALLAANKDVPFEELEPLVAELHQRYYREVPPPITGTMAVKDPEDKFGG